MPSTVFLGVDREDQKSVSEYFPDATIIEEALNNEELVESCKDAEIISAFINSAFPKEVLEQLPNLKLLCTRSVGYDHIDLDTCAKRKITVCHVPDYGSHVIAEHVFALLLSTLRHIPEADKRVEAGEFDYHGLRGISLQGKTLGIVGTGKIGRKVAQIAHGFGMQILATDRCRTLELESLYSVSYVSFEELLKDSDIITLHLPSTEDTYHIVDAKAFSLMKDDVVLVNTARGELIDTTALFDALSLGKVTHALLDVLEHEKNFEENKELISHPNVVTTPHIAFYAEESMRNMYEDCFASIQQWQAGEMPKHVAAPPTKVCDMAILTGK